MAQLDSIRDAVRRQPFKPFTIRMADGTSCFVRHPDWLLIPPIKRPCEIAFVGGLFRNPAFTERVYAETRERLPDCKIVAPTTDPAEGALILARRA